MSEGIDGPWRLPKGWTWASFADVARVASNLVSPFDYPELPHIAPNHIESETGRLLPFSTVAEDGVKSPKHLFSSEHILYSKIRPYLAKVVMVKFEGLCSADMYPIATELDPGYLALWLRCPAFTGLAVNHQGRSVLPKINKEALAKLPVPVPPLEEQQRIVAALEEQLSRLDAADKALGDAGRRIALTVRSLLNQHVGSPGVRARGWRYERLEDVAEIRGGQTPRKNSAEFHAEWAPGLVPFWKVGDMNGGDGRLMNRSRTYMSGEEISRAKIRTYPAGTVLLPKRGGAIATNKKRITAAVGAFDLNVMGVVPRKGIVPEFLWYWFQTIDLNELSDGSNVPQINKPDLSHLLVPVPSEDEQKAVVRQLDDLLAHFDRLQSTMSNVRPSQLRASLFQQAFAGRLVPQNTADEPANALLARIRAERASAGAARSRRPSPRRAPAQRGGAPGAPPPPRADASALAAATQPTLDLEIPS